MATPGTYMSREEALVDLRYRREMISDCILLLGPETVLGMVLAAVRAHFTTVEKALMEHPVEPIVRELVTGLDLPILHGAPLALAQSELNTRFRNIFSNADFEQVTTSAVTDMINRGLDDILRGH